MAETIALIGGETLLGRELQEVLSESVPGARVRLIAGESEAAGTLTEFDGAADFLARLDPKEIRNTAAVVLAGSSQMFNEIAGDAGNAVVVDLTYAAEDDPRARIRAPLVEDETGDIDVDGPQVIAHPAAIAITLLLTRLHRAHPIARSVIHVFEPASERGNAGVDELQQQTIALLSLKQMPKKIFDSQLSFNLLPQLGEGAVRSITDIEERIERHLATLLDHPDAPPMPSLRLIQAPVFHGYSFSVWLEFEEAPPAGEIEELLSGEGIEVRTGQEEPPSNVGVAGQSGVAVGAIAPDRNASNAMWIWMAADNLRLAAENAALVVRQLV